MHHHSAAHLATTPTTTPTTTLTTTTTNTTPTTPIIVLWLLIAIGSVIGSAIVIDRCMAPLGNGHFQTLAHHPQHQHQHQNRNQNQHQQQQLLLASDSLESVSGHQQTATTLHAMNLLRSVKTLAATCIIPASRR
jgi:hypothetical protein